MSTRRWLMVIAVLLAVNLVRWWDRAPWTGVAAAHNVADETGTAAADTMLTSFDEEWEAAEIYGTRTYASWNIQSDTNADRFPEFAFAQVNRPSGSAPQIVCLNAPAGNKGMGPNLFTGPGGAAMTAAVAVTKWRVHGHMHRGRGRP